MSDEPQPPWSIPSAHPMPPLHDPRTRCLIDDTPSGWQVYGNVVNGQHHAYFAPRGMLHLQWWHPFRLASVITPSRLTQGRYELWMPQHHLRICCYEHLATRLRELARLDVPCPGAMRHYDACFVRVWEIGRIPDETCPTPAMLPW